MGFDAADEPELTYDFTKYVPDAMGVTPEPPDVLVIAFGKAMAAIVAPYTAERDPAVKPTAKDIGMVIEKAGETLTDMVTAVAKLCQDSPSADEINGLPWRLKQNFVGYMTGLFISSGKA